MINGNIGNWLCADIPYKKFVHANGKVMFVLLIMHGVRRLPYVR